MIMGLKFPNRVGLAAGLDKNAEYITPLSKLGFGFIEVGTVTPRSQPGNSKPRSFRLIKRRVLLIDLVLIMLVSINLLKILKKPSLMVS